MISESKKSLKPLVSVSAGSDVKLAIIDAGRELKQRLANMGIMPGCLLHVLTNDRFGPFVIAIKGSRVILGRGMAQKIMVEQ